MVWFNSHLLIALVVYTGCIFSIPSSAFVITGGVLSNGHETTSRTYNGFQSPKKCFLRLQVSNTADQAAKFELFEILCGQPMSLATLEGQSRFEYLLDHIESSFKAPNTLGFLNFALLGQWHLMYSSQVPSNEGPIEGEQVEITILEVSQHIGGDSDTAMSMSDVKLNTEALHSAVKSKELLDTPLTLSGDATNIIGWSIPKEDCHGMLTIRSKYKQASNTGGLLIVDEKSHEMDSNKEPEDPEGLIDAILREVPEEMVDPAGLIHETTYLDSDIRISTLYGRGMDGGKNIFVREGSPLLDILIDVNEKLAEEFNKTEEHDD